MERIEYCYLHNPPYPVRSKPKFTLTLKGQLKGGIRQSPTQIWTASMLKPDGTECIVVAKFFDPLYFADQDHDDAFKITQMAVACEHEAYGRLLSLQGKEIPWYFGLYVAPFPIPDYPTRSTRPSSRNVYVVLLELIPGTPLDKIHVESLGDKRKQIMENVFELREHVSALGVHHRDFFPRNLILRPGTGGKEDTVVLFDFEQSWTFEISNVEWDSSEAGKAQRIAELKADPSLLRTYSQWMKSKWINESGE